MTVMIVDSQLPRAQWPVGQIVKVITSHEVHIRAAEVKVQYYVYLRPVGQRIRKRTHVEAAVLNSKSGIARQSLQILIGFLAATAKQKGHTRGDS